MAAGVSALGMVTALVAALPGVPRDGGRLGLHERSRAQHHRRPVVRATPRTGGERGLQRRDARRVSSSSRRSGCSIGALGFPRAVVAAAVVMLLVLVPIALLVLRRGPETLGLAPDGDPPHAHGPRAPRMADDAGRMQAMRTWRFWSVSAPFALGLAAQVGLLTHLVALLTPPLGLGGAARAVGLTTFAAMIGRLVTGLVVDRLDRADRRERHAGRPDRAGSRCSRARRATGDAVRRLRAVRARRRQSHHAPRAHRRRRVAARALRAARRPRRRHQSAHVRVRTVAGRRRARLERRLRRRARALHDPAGLRRRARSPGAGKAVTIIIR